MARELANKQAGMDGIAEGGSDEAMSEEEVDPSKLTVLKKYNEEKDGGSLICFPGGRFVLRERDENGEEMRNIHPEWSQPTHGWRDLQTLICPIRPQS